MQSAAEPPELAPNKKQSEFSDRCVGGHPKANEEAARVDIHGAAFRRPRRGLMRATGRPQCSSLDEILTTSYTVHYNP